MNPHNNTTFLNTHVYIVVFASQNINPGKIALSVLHHKIWVHIWLVFVSLHHKPLNIIYLFNTKINIFSKLYSFLAPLIYLHIYIPTKKDLNLHKTTNTTLKQNYQPSYKNNNLIVKISQQRGQYSSNNRHGNRDEIYIDNSFGEIKYLISQTFIYFNSLNLEDCLWCSFS